MYNSFIHHPSLFSSHHFKSTKKTLCPLFFCLRKCHLSECDLKKNEEEKGHIFNLNFDFLHSCQYCIFYCWCFVCFQSLLVDKMNHENTQQESRICNYTLPSHTKLPCVLTKKKLSSRVIWIYLFNWTSAAYLNTVSGIFQFMQSNDQMKSNGNTIGNDPWSRDP